MSNEYQADLSSKLTELKPVAREISDKMKTFFEKGYQMDLNFREKSTERTIVKDIEYRTHTTNSTQVKDLFAARLIANPDNPADAKKMKEYVLERFNKEFNNDRTPIKFICEPKEKSIRYKGEMVTVTPLYITFNNHIELQVVTSEECLILTHTHDDYVKRRAGGEMVTTSMS
jgi:hypothetical protein